MSWWILDAHRFTVDAPEFNLLLYSNRNEV
jgi:hypothetical protein